MTTPRYLLDTNSCVAIRNSLRAKPHKDEARQAAMERLAARWRSMSAHELAMSFITLGELAVYAEMNSNAPKARAVLARIKQSIAVLGAAEGTHPTSAEALGHRYAEIRADLQRRGRAIGGLSALAVSTAKAKVERTLKVEIDDEAFERVYGFRSHPIPAGSGRRVAVRVISQFGEESTKVLTL